MQVISEGREDSAQSRSGGLTKEFPKGTPCAFMPSSSSQLAVRLFLTAGFDLTTRAILDTGSGPTLIDRRLLPVDTLLQPLGGLAKMFHDVNEGWLPIVKDVYLGVTLAGQTSYFSFGVLINKSVPAILGTSFINVATKDIATQEQGLSEYGFLAVSRPEYGYTPEYVAE